MHGQAVQLKNMEQVVFYLREMSPEEADEKYENVMRQRHMFIYKSTCAPFKFILIHLSIYSHPRAFSYHDDSWHSCA